MIITLLFNYFVSRNVTVAEWVFNQKGRFNDYVTLKLSFFDPPKPHYQALSPLFTRTLLRYLMLSTNAHPPPPFPSQ